MTNATEAAEAAVRDVIQRVYNDASQTILDHRAAVAIVQRLRDMGWGSADEAALLVEAAGGSVNISHAAIADIRPLQLLRIDEPVRGGVELRSRRVSA